MKITFGKRAAKIESGIGNLESGELVMYRLIKLLLDDKNNICLYKEYKNDKQDRVIEFNYFPEDECFAD